MRITARPSAAPHPPPMRSGCPRRQRDFPKAPTRGAIFLPRDPAPHPPARLPHPQSAMSPELEQLIRLQQLDNLAEEARRRIADVPDRIAALDAALSDLAGQAWRPSDDGGTGSMDWEYLVVVARRA